MKIPKSCRFLMFSFLFVIILSGCHPSPRELTVVTGKTVYGDLALENARLEIFRWEKDQWEFHYDTRSGYHGSFRIHLPVGKYKLAASKTIRIGKGKVTVTGKLDELEVKESSRRIDQVVIFMASKPEP